MKKKLIAAGAAGLAVATVVTGLSFGAAAAPNSPRTGTTTASADDRGAAPGLSSAGLDSESPDQDTTTSVPGRGTDTRRATVQTEGLRGKLVWRDSATGSYRFMRSSVASAASGGYGTNYEDALAQSDTFEVPARGQRGVVKAVSGASNGLCFSAESRTNNWIDLVTCRPTNAMQQFYWEGDTLRLAQHAFPHNGPYLTAYRSGEYWGPRAVIRSSASAASFVAGAFEEITSLTATVSSVDHLARTAVITGTARPGARVEAGGAWVTANETTGAFSMTVSGLAPGANALTVIQRVGGTQVGNSVPLTVTIVEGGTVVPVPQPGVELVRGETTSVPFVVQFNERREAVSGTVTVTAPAGTTFAPGQTTVPGLYRNGTTGDWRTSSTTGLAGGTLNADRTQMTFTQGPSSGGHVEGQQWRYEFQVETPLVAAAGSSSMGYVFAGSTPGNPFRAEGSTTTTIEVNEQPTVASVVSVDPIAKTAVVSGTATPGATITIGDQEAVVQDDGTWSMTVEGLQVGSNQLVVQQSIAGEPYGDPVTLDAVVAALTTSLGANDVTVTSEADGWFTEGTEGTVTITTQTGTSPTGATVRPGESLSWTTTLPEGFEAGDLPATETVDGWTTEHVVATDSEGRQTVEVKVTNGTTENREYTAAGDITFSVVSTGKPAADGTITTVFTPPTSYTSSAPDASTVAKAPLPLTATVAQRNDIAQTVVVTGSGTPGQQVTIGDVTETIRPDGSYEITAPFTGTGDLEVTVSQAIGGTVHDEATVEFTSVEGGTLVGVQQTRVNLPRNTTSIIPIVVQNNEARDDATGTVTFTAPKDTIFQDGLTVLGEHRSGTAGGWESDASLDLTGGVISENGTKITFQLPARAIPAEQQLRYLVEVFTSRTASAGNRQLDYTYEGTSSIGDFRATGSTIGRVASIDPSAIRE